MSTWTYRVLPSPAQGLGVMGLVCLALLGLGLYLQHGVGLEPCPMCIVQRYVMVLIALVALLCSWPRRPSVQAWGLGFSGVLAGFGAFVAARQSWLQWFPPESYSCGRDFYGMIETFPLKRAIPMIFRGSGDCTKVDWTFLGLSIANGSFLAFLGLGSLSIWLLWRHWLKPVGARAQRAIGESG